MKLSDNLKQSEGLMVLRGNVKILDDKGNVELDQDNAITDYFRRILMAKLLNDITISFTDLEGITGEAPDNISVEATNGFISDIKFGAGSSANIGAKASKTDNKLIAPIPEVLSDNSGDPLYINTSIFEGLGVDFDFSDLKIQFSSDLINNDTKTYILGELGIFYSTDKVDTQTKKMLTHLYFDPIFFEPDTSKKIIYTIYFY
jgi:hypothetical protein